MAFDYGTMCRSWRGSVEIEIYSRDGGWSYCAILICFPVIMDALSWMVNGWSKRWRVWSSKWDVIMLDWVAGMERVG